VRREAVATMYPVTYPTLFTLPDYVL
jgi:hypothetical protein